MVVFVLGGWGGGCVCVRGGGAGGLGVEGERGSHHGKVRTNNELNPQETVTKGNGKQTWVSEVRSEHLSTVSPVLPTCK